jgi:hypothetical protein
MQRRLVFIFCLTLLIPVQAAAQADDARAKAWQEDLDVMAKGLQEKHLKPFTVIKQEDFLQKVTELRRRIPELKDHQIQVEFMKLAALIGDGHTVVGPGPEAKRWRRYPISTLWVKDGLVIIAASEQFKDLIRAKIVGVGKLSMDDAEKQLHQLAGHENAHARKEAIRTWLVIPEILAGLGIIDDMEKAPLTIVDRAGQRRTVTLQPLPPSFRGRFVTEPDPEKEKLPVSRQVRHDRYGFAWLSENNTLYCWYDSCMDLPNRPVSAWCADVLKAVDEKKPERIVLDLRRNSGGNSALINPLMSGLRARPAYNQPGRLMVLIGRFTFSSGMMNAIHFRQRHQAVLIGSPTGGSPNSFGEIRHFPLPNSKWQVQYSTKFFKLTNDGATTVKPDVEVEWTAEDFFAGRDTVLEAALKYGK